MILISRDLNYRTVICYGTNKQAMASNFKTCGIL